MSPWRRGFRTGALDLGQPLQTCTLCIGVDKYEHLSELTNAVRDARAVAQKVQGECSVPIHLDRAGSGV